MQWRGMLTKAFEALAPMLGSFLMQCQPSCHVDIQTAFSIVSWEWIWLALRWLVVPEWLVDALQSPSLGSNPDVAVALAVAKTGLPI